MGMEPPAPSQDPGPKIEFLVELARRATRIHAGIPAPRRSAEGLAEGLEFELSFAATAGAGPEKDSLAEDALYSSGQPGDAR